MSKERAGLIVDFSMECKKLSAMALSLSLLSFSYHLLGSICECCLNAKGTAKDEPVPEIRVEWSGVS
jgi:hypothetical protein